MTPFTLKNWLTTDSLTINLQLSEVLETAILSSQDLLTVFANDTEFDSKMAQIFAEDDSPEISADVLTQTPYQSYRQGWLENEFSILGNIEIRYTNDIGGVNGAYSAQTDIIYLSIEFLEQNKENPATIIAVLLEEAGHRIDAQLNTTDTQGDEGEYFSAVVRGETLSTEALEQIQAENDQTTVILNGQELEIEQNTNPTIRSGEEVTDTITTGNESNSTREGSYKVDYQLTNIIANQLMTLELKSDDFDAYLQLIDADTGEVINADDDSGNYLNSRLSFVPQEGINYIARVTTYNYQATGDYTLTVSGNGADLVITNPVVSDVIFNGDSATVTWEVTNQGSLATTNKFLSHSIYISDDNIFDASTDTLLTFSDLTQTADQAQILEAGQNLEFTRSLRFPSNLESGEHYLLFVADSNNDQIEQDEENNITVVPITINQRDIDLVVTDFTASERIAYSNFRTNPISVHWTVQNQGLEANFTNWIDYLYLSQDEFIDEEDFQAYGAGQFSIRAGDFDEYTREISFYEEVAPGSYYLIIKTDSQDNVGEVNEDNNVKVLPIEIVSPNLELTSVQAPDTITIGQDFAVTWQVTNTSDFTLSENTWYDRVFISQDDTWDAEDKEILSKSINRYDFYQFPLTPGIGYTVSEQINIANNLVDEAGDYYLLFVTDAGEQQTETNEIDNVYAQAITVNTPTVLPNLTITEDSIPDVANLAETINVSWTVSNNGDIVTNRDWIDGVYLSDDETIDDDDLVLGSKNTVGDIFGNNKLTPLDVDSDYTTSLDVTLPITGAGDQYILIATDIDNTQGEKDETDNTLIVPITINEPAFLPNLTIAGNDIPESANVGEELTISWTVTNNTDFATTNPWYDYVYLSDDEIIDEDDTFLGSKDTRGTLQYDPFTYSYYYTNSLTPLAAGASYTTSINTALPAGNHYILVSPDHLNAQNETDENDNLLVVPITINSGNSGGGDTEDLLPNLVITDVTAPESGSMGEAVNLSWTVKNIGEGIANTNWMDHVYISEDQVYDGADLRIGTYSGTPITTLNPDQTYTVNTNVTLPKETKGAYLLFLTDGDQYGSGNYFDVQSETNELDNWAVHPIKIEFPNLEVTTATASDDISLGSPFTASWTVENTGTGDAIANFPTFAWYDRVYISDDAYLDDDDSFYGATIRSRSLNAGDTYEESLTLALSANEKGGDRYLLFVTDDGKDEYEAEENDNVYALPININSPNLKITATAPETAVVNDPINISWQVTNDSNLSTNAFAWRDYVYLSTDENWDDDDIEITSRYINTPLAAQDAYEYAFSLGIPGVTPGDYHLIFVTDRNQNQGETNEVDNITSLPITINAPNLTVTAATAPAQGTVGQANIKVDWTVENIGEYTARQNWSDSIYLSKDDQFDGSDISLRSRSNYSDLAPNQSYSAFSFIDLPINQVGDYHLLIVTNSSSNIYNRQGETNFEDNVFAVPITIDGNGPNLNITQDDISAPSVASVGESIDLSWTVRNDGGVTTNGAWRENVYLSKNTTYDYSDRQLASLYQGNIPAGSEFTRNQTISVPGDVEGEQYLLFIIDQYDNSKETNENDNTVVVPITIASAGPDLTITEVSAPDIAALGETITLSWTVFNQGEAPAEANWIDHVYLSTDQIISSSDRKLTPFNGVSAAEYTPLEDGSGYTVEVSALIPHFNSQQTGDFYFLFSTDDNKQQGETDETNNVYAHPVTLKAPNLQVTAATAPGSALLSETIEVTWTVTNVGEVVASVDWFDYIFISDDENLDFFDDSFITNVSITEQTPLAPGESYTVSSEITIPQIEEGDNYLLFRVDGSTYQKETDETDNTLAIPITIGGANLVISEPTAPASANIGETIDLSWKVSNNGGVSAPADWVDRVYLSDDQTLDDSDTQLLEVSTDDNSPLDSGVSYAINQSATIPNSEAEKAGDRYLLFVTNDDQTQGENNRTDNIVAVPFELQAPNLAFKDQGVNAPSDAVLGESIDLSWIIENIGTGEAVADWWDTIYISDDDKIDYGVDQYLTRFDQAIASPLAAGDEYNTEVNITLPLRTNPGDRYLLLLADGKYPRGSFFGVRYVGDFQAEINENDNVYAIPINLIAPELVDLTVSEIVAPVEVISGQSIEVSWFITNEGNDEITGTWNDQVFLSADDTVGGDIFLETFSFTGTIGAGETQEIKHLVEIPIDISGDHWFVVKTDADDDKIEYFSEDNNTRIDEIPINVILSPFPNLQVTAVNPPNTAFSSQETVVEWTVTNTGDAPTNAPFWYDRVWLSEDDVLDASDVDLGVVVNPNYLQVGESYTNELTVTLPQGIDDDYYFIVETDVNYKGVNNAVYEFENEDDNVGVGDATDVQLTPPPDLQVTTVTAPNNAFSGSRISLTWTVENKGEGETLQSEWYDEIYLSTDETLEGGDILLEEFEHRGILNADGSYTRTEFVTLPRELSGEYYFIVKTDGKETVFEQAFESNNTGFDNTNIVLALPVDIEGELVEGSETIIAGHTLDIEVEVSVFENGLNDSWTDAFYLSRDLNFDPETDIYLGSYFVEYPEIYEEQFLPSDIPVKVITVGEADQFTNLVYPYMDFLVQGQLNELTKVIPIGNGSFGVSIFIQSNPLTASSDDYIVGQYIQNSFVNFRMDISQDDEVEATESFELILPQWVYSSQATSDPVHKVIVNIIDNDTIGVPNIKVNDTFAFEGEQNIYIPIILDKASTEPITVSYTTEDGTAGKDTDYTATTGSVTFEPGEVVKNIAVNIRQDLVAEEEERFNFVITNSTGGVITDNRATATILASSGYKKYPFSYKTPADLEGDYYLVAVADNGDSIYEFDEENNVFYSAQPVTIVSPGEDLVVSDVTVDNDIVKGGDYIYLDWTVTNDGTNDTIGFGNLYSRSLLNGPITNLGGNEYLYQDITDKIILSQDEILGNDDDVELATNISKPDVLPDGTLEYVKGNGYFSVEEGGDYYTTYLQPGESYQRKLESVLIPFNVTPGEYHLFVTTDTEEFIDEEDETNNYTSIPITIAGNLPDLQVTNINILTDVNNLQSGENLTLEWTVTNTGTNRTDSQTWSDRIYLSKDQIISNDDILLENRNHNNGLNTEDEYTKIYSNVIPIDAEGDYYVLIATDTNNAVSESSDENNLLASEKITISLGDVPDLVVESIDVPEVGISGQQLEINVAIANNGQATEETFFTSFYLSLDQSFDKENDIYIGSLGPIIFENNELVFDIPRGLSGRYYAFAVVDSKDEIYEREGELNNITYAPQSINIILPPPADLVVTEITIPDEVITLGDFASFSYTIQNQGTDAALGSWFDSVYLSKDEKWDLDDVLIAKNQHQGDIALGESYQGFAGLSPSTPVTPGEYHVLVRTDIRNQVEETNDDNNLGVSVGKVTIDVEALALNNPTTGVIEQDEAVYYKVDVAAGESLLFDFDGQYHFDNSGFTELYVSYGEMPTRSDFDFNYQVPLEADQQILVPATEAGTYYVMAYGNSVPEYQGDLDEYTNYTIEAKTIDFAILDTDFGVGGTAGNRTLEINGNKFDRTVTAKLTNEQGIELIADDYYRVDDTKLYATFDLTQVAPGIYDITIENSQGETSTVEDSFEVVAGGGANLSTWVDNPPAIARPVPDFPFVDRLHYNFNLNWFNDGINDAIVPVFTISSNDEFGDSMAEIVDGFGEYIRTFYGTAAEEGPAGIILPNQSKIETLVTRNSPVPRPYFSDIIYQFDETYELLTEEFDWQTVDLELSILDIDIDIDIDIDAENPDPIFTQLIEQVGTTNGDFLEMLSENANLLPPELGDTQEIQDLLELEVNEAIAALNTSITGRISAPDFAVDISGQQVSAVNITTNELFITTSLNDGSLILETVTPGEYIIDFAGGVITNSDPIVVNEGDSLTDVVLNAEKGASLTGVFTHADTEEPIAGAEITISRLDDAVGDFVTVTTDEDGRYPIPHLAAGEYSLIARKEGLADFSTEFTVDSLSDQIELNIETVNAGQLTGTIYDETGVTGLADATGVLIPVGEEEAYRGFITDENGNFELSAIAPGEYTLQVFASDYTNGIVENVIVTEDGVNNLTVNLSPSASITGEVVLPDGVGFGDVSVELVSATGEIVDFEITQADGSYNFEDLAAGNYTIKVLNNIAPITSVVVELEAGSDLSAPDLTIPIFSSISGTVFDGLNQGLDDVYVSLFTADGAELLSVDANIDGEFSFGVFEAGTYQITAFADTGIYGTTEIIIPAEGTSINDLSLTPGTLTLAGQVYSPNNTLLADAPVVISYLDGNLESPQTLSTTTDATGNFNLNGLIDGNYEIVTVPDGYGFAETQVTVAGENLTDIDIQATQSRSISGVVFDSDNNLVTEADISIYKAGTNELVALRTPDENGAFTVEDLAPSNYDIDVIADGYTVERITDINVSQGDSNSTITLDMSDGSISGQVLTSNGDPVAQELVFAFDESDKIIGFTETAEDGSYEFTNLPSENVYLEVATPGYFPVSSSSFDLGVNPVNIDVNLVLSEGGFELVIDENLSEISVGLTPLATRSDSWFFDAFFREIEPELDLDKPTKPKCKEDQELYNRALKEWSEVQEAYEQVNDRQLSFQNQAIDTLANILWYSANTGIDIAAAVLPVAKAGTLLIKGAKSLEALKALSIIKTIEDADTILDYIDTVTKIATIPPNDLNKLYEKALRFLSGQALKRAGKETPPEDWSSLWNRLAKEADKFVEANFQPVKLKELVVGNSVEDFVRQVEEYGTGLAGRNQVRQLILNINRFAGLVSSFFSFYDAYVAVTDKFDKLVTQEGKLLANEWSTFIQAFDQYEEEYEEAQLIIERYEQGNQVGDLKLNNDRYSIREDSRLAGNVLENDVKANCAQNLIVHLSQPTRNGTVSLNSDGTFTYTPNANYVGSDLFRYYVTSEDQSITFAEEAAVLIQVNQDCADDTDPKSCHEQSFDPNDILGPNGYGEENWITARQPLNYTIRFENDAELATAPAQTVHITQQLDDDLDLRTFRLGNFGFGEFVFEVPDNQAIYQTRLDLTETLGVYVDVFAGINVTSGEAFWELTAIDPETGEVPISVLEGFLPPNEDGLEGQGFVNYTIQAKEDVPTGTVIDAEASIIFDINEPIITPPIFNTIDADKPTSTITALPSETEETEFVVQWSGEDTADGSGLASYTIYVSTNGGAFTPWLNETTDTEALFTGEIGNTYEFYSVAIDNAGNRQNLPLQAQANIFIDGEITASIGNFIWEDINANGIQDEGENGLADVTVTLYDSNNNLIDTTTTDADGFYGFRNIVIGDYILEVTTPDTYRLSPQNQGDDNTLDSDFDPNTGFTNIFNLTREGDRTQDAGLYQTATITGTIWDDVNEDGIQNPEETGLENWTVYLDTNNNQQLDEGEITTLTDADGNYRFDDLTPDTYTVTQVLKTGWEQTYPVTTTTASNIPLSLPSVEQILPTENQTQLNFSASEYIVEESGKAITEVIITRTGDTANPLTVTLTLTDGTAEGCGCVPTSIRTDFNYTPIEITFAENEVNKIIPVENALLANPDAIRIRNDNKVEGEEYFTISLTDPTAGAIIGTQGTAKVTIIDDEAPSDPTMSPNNNVSSPSEIVNTFSTDINNNQATNLINLNDFWLDSRFANIKGQGKTTVIIDTGADLDHPLLGPDNDQNGVSDRIVYQYDFADNDNNASDFNNHGSHITSIASQIAPEANLIILKVFSDDGSGSFAHLEEALQWVNLNADPYNVTSVNLSLGDSQNWQTEESRYGIGDELAAIASQNILIAGAAGNAFYTFNSEPGLAYPAIDPNVISVGAVWADDFGSRNFNSGAVDHTTDADRIASFSQRHPLLDVFAPGILITGADSNGGTITMGGTSQATPYITGIATLAQQIAQQYLGRELTLSEFNYLLDNTSDIIIDGDDEEDNVNNTGESYPRINVIALAEGILTLEGNNSTNNPIETEDTNDNTPITNTLALTHTITLESGDIIGDLDFGNQYQDINQPPEIDINNGLIVDEDSSQIITNSQLNVIDADNLDTEITYTLTNIPDNGILTLDGVELILGNTFTQANINSDRLIYSHNGSETLSDSFLFTINDSDDGNISETLFNITVNPVDDLPVVENAIASFSVDEDAENDSFDVSNLFFDADGDEIEISVDNSNQGLVNVTLENNLLTLDYLENESGEALITLTGLANGEIVETNFTVTVNPVDDLPVVENEIPDVNVTEDSDNTVIDLANIFNDVDNNNEAIIKTVLVNSNKELVNASIDSNNLILSYLPNQFGIAEITIQATSNGETIEDTFAVNVTPINDSPNDISITNLSITENAPNNTLIGRLSTIDPDLEDTYTYTLSDDAQGRFKIVGDELQVADTSQLDFEEDPDFDILVQSKDNDGLSIEKIFTVSLIDDRDFDVIGTVGDDLINSGIGGEVITGLGGKDTYIYDSIDDFGDVIADFNANNDDLIDLKSLYNSYTAFGYDLDTILGENPFEDLVSVTTNGSNNAQIHLSPFGQLLPDYQLPLVTLEGVTSDQIDATDFIFR